MPSIELFVSEPLMGSPVPDGNLDLDPPIPGLNRVLLRQLICSLRIPLTPGAPPIPGAFTAIFDTGAPLTIFPHNLWHHQFKWQAGRDFDEVSIAELGATLSGQVLGYQYSCRLVRLRMPVELSGKNLKGDRLRIDSLVCQLAEQGGPPYIILGLWGGVFTGRQLAIEQQPNSDDLQARLLF